MKKILKAVGAWSLVALVAGGLFVGIFNPTYTATFSQTQANDVAAQSLPVTDRVLGMPYTLEAVELTFLETNRIQVAGTLSVADRYAADLQAEGTLVYREGSFYIEGLDVQKVTFENRDPTEVEEDLFIIGRDAIGDLRGRRPENAEAMRRLQENLFAPMIPAAENFVAATLASTPVYTLDSADFKQNVARLALKEVNVADQQLSVTLSGRTVVLKVVGFGLALLGAIGFAWAMSRAGFTGLLGILVLAG